MAHQNRFRDQDEDDDDNFFDLDDQQPTKINTNFGPTSANSNGNSLNSSAMLEDSIISRTIKGLADKAYELSLKYDLKDEAKLIQQEEVRLAKILNEEMENRSQMTSKFQDDNMNMRNGSSNLKNFQQQKELQMSQRNTPSYGTQKNPSQSKLLQQKNNKFRANQAQSKETLSNMPQNSIFTTTSNNQNTNMNIFNEETLENEDEDDENNLNQSEVVLNTAVQRLFDDATRRKELKERIQLLSAKRELEELRQQPEICKKSNKLLTKSKNQYVPIHERYDKVLQQTQQKRSQFEAEIFEESIQKDPDEFFPSFKPKVNKQKGRQPREIKQIVEQIYIWQAEKQYNQIKNKNQQERDIDKQCTFKPKINLSSSVILSQNDKFHIDDFLSRVEKFIDMKEQKIKIIDKHLRRDHTFKPNTYSNNTQAAKYYERKLKKQDVSIRSNQSKNHDLKSVQYSDPAYSGTLTSRQQSQSINQSIQSNSQVNINKTTSSTLSRESNNNSVHSSQKGNLTSRNLNPTQNIQLIYQTQQPVNSSTQRTSNTTNTANFNSQNNQNYDKSMTPTFNMSVVESQRYSKEYNPQPINMMEHSFAGGQSFAVELSDFITEQVQHDQDRGSDDQLDQDSFYEIVKSKDTKSDDRLTQLTYSNGRNGHTNDSLTNLDNNQQWLFSSTHNQSNQSNERLSKDVAPFSMRSNEMNLRKNDLQQNLKQVLYNNITTEAQSRKIDIQEYLRSLEQKMKIDEEELDQIANSIKTSSQNSIVTASLVGSNLKLY
ncbi:UNKNOWN [Stylonychia lemnae]|uniref:Uncharacterized protein n=1 Tax=Stylonychia lemnae TaxID=5949 RepID=A0A078AMC5_STYLE|nr:UNKNOWN [Stylonychia lemnae]|eukprot:CDW83550.1 UNKNOWN [Stylonychia lemnae]